MNDDGEKVAAWRCEHCRKFYPASIASSVILVNEIAERWTYSGAVAKKGRFVRRMVVCPPCRQKISDGPLDGN